MGRPIARCGGYDAERPGHPGRPHGVGVHRSDGKVDGDGGGQCREVAIRRVVVAGARRRHLREDRWRGDDRRRRARRGPSRTIVARRSCFGVGRRRRRRRGPRRGPMTKREEEAPVAAHRRRAKRFHQSGQHIRKEGAAVGGEEAPRALFYRTMYDDDGDGIVPTDNQGKVPFSSACDSEPN